MGLIRRTPTSLRDFQLIWDYIAADDLLRTFDEKLKLLSDFPNAGPARPELRQRIRSFPVGNYVIFYRPIRGGIELIRVLHGARDIRQIFRGK
jgi:toxin ParE1/3/4